MRSPSLTDSVDGRSRLRPTLEALCVTEITSWGVLYYAFPVLADSLSADTGWSRATTTAAFSISLLVAAGVGVPVGRMLDRLGPRWVMTAGSVVASATVVGIALAPNLVVFFVVWIVAGVAMAAIFYQPAFAALTRWYGDDRVHALTVLTLAAGFSSTIFAPLTGVLVSRFDWRATYLILAALLAVVTIPLHAWFLRPPWPDAPRPADSTVTGGVGEILRSRAFVCLTVAFALGAFAAFAVVFNLVPLLTGRGLSTETAAWALGLGGVGQVLGRTGYRRVVRSTTVTQRTVGILLAGAVAIAALGLLRGPTLALIALAMTAGAIRGISTLLQATAVSDRWGAEHYGTVSGVLTAPVMTAMAIAPWAGAALASVIGYPALFIVLAATGAVGAGVAAWATPGGSSALPEAPRCSDDNLAKEEPMNDPNDVEAEVREYFAEAAVAAGAGSAACCGPEADQFGAGLYDDLDGLPDAATLASIGCGNPVAVADLHPGDVVLDLGSGGGIDVLLSARRVGPTGKAYGVDFTPQMLDLARRNAAEAGATNVEFLDGHIDAVPLPDASVDVIISNCVVNLAVDKSAVFTEMRRLLRPGGRIGISDVVTEDRITAAERAERGSYVACIAGALPMSDYRAGLEAAGLVDVSIECTHAVADGVHAAVVRARKPASVLPV